MGEIPEDVRAAVNECFKGIRWEAFEMSGGGDGPHDYECREDEVFTRLCLAILAERKRCAEAARRVADECYGDTSAIGAAASINSAILNP